MGNDDQMNENTIEPIRGHTVYEKLLKQLHRDIEQLHGLLDRIGKNLKTIRDRQLYVCGGYGTFAEFCQKEFGKDRTYVHRLIQAHETIQLLLLAGVHNEDLPDTERLCRELRKLEPQAQAPVWSAVKRAAQKAGRQPEARDITERAAKKDLPGARERQKDELLSKFRGIAKALRIGLSVEELDADIAFRNSLVEVLMDIATTVTQLLKTINHDNRNTGSSTDSPGALHQDSGQGDAGQAEILGVER